MPIGRTGDRLVTIVFDSHIVPRRDQVHNHAGTAGTGAASKCRFHRVVGKWLRIQECPEDARDDLVVWWRESTRDVLACFRKSMTASLRRKRSQTAKLRGHVYCPEK